MGRKKYYDDNKNECADSDGESVHSIDEKIQQFTLTDFLNFPKTREILEMAHYQTFLDTATLELQDLFDEIYDYCQKQMSSVLRMDLAERGKGTVLGMIYNHIEKEYKTDIFENYPELARPLINAEKEKNNNNSSL